MGAQRLVAALSAKPELADVASDQQSKGFGLNVEVDRDRASRLNVLPQAIDDTLYDAFGQRQVSIIFTQLNQYRVVLEAEPKFPAQPGRLGQNLRQIHHRPDGAPERLRLGHHRPRPRWSSCTRASSRPSPSPSTSARTVRWTPPSRPSPRRSRRLACPKPLPPVSPAAPPNSALPSRREPLLILAAVIVIYIILGVLYESYIHPVTILSSLPSAGVGALLALMLFHIELSLVSLIGIILLIGIVQKNAIMMIDFALDAERRGASAPGTVHLQGLPTALPSRS